MATTYYARGSGFASSATVTVYRRMGDRFDASEGAALASHAADVAGTVQVSVPGVVEYMPLWLSGLDSQGASRAVRVLAKQFTTFEMHGQHGDA